MMIIFGIFIILLSLSLISYLIYYYWKNNKSKNRVKYYNKRQNYYSQTNSQTNSNQNSGSYLIDNSVYYDYFYGTNNNHKHIDNNGLNNTNTNNKTTHSDMYLETITNNCESTHSSSSDSSSSCGD